MTTTTDTDANRFSEEVAHIERVSLLQQSRRLSYWGRTPVADRIASLTPLATAFDNRSPVKTTGPKSFTWSGGMVVVVSSSEQAERDALLKLIGSVPAMQLPILIVVNDQEGAAYYQSLDPAAKDMRVVGTVSKYVTSLAGILNSLANPPPTIQREFARVTASAQLLENGGRDAKPSRQGLLAPLHRRRRQPTKPLS